MAHSLSPVLHTAGFASTDAPWTYVAFDVAAGDAGRALEAMRTLRLGGLSVTTPHKQEAADGVDELAGSARSLRSINTVVVGDRGRLVGHSTDGDGFVASLVEQGVELRGTVVALLGAGGAARSLIDALARAGVADISVINRTAAHAEGAAALADVAHVGAEADVGRADIVINATTVGMGTEQAACDRTLLHARQVVADIVYHPLDTALLRAARAIGATVVDGLGMLVHQAVLQQQLWTGRRPDPVAMRRAAAAELARRR